MTHQLKFVLIAIGAVGTLVLPSMGSAHGGVLQQAERSVVIYFQEPLSAVVGEPVTMTFIIRGDDGQPVPNLEVAIVVTESLTEDQAGDQAVDRQTLRSDSNGALTLTEVFSRPNYFDVELTYTVPGADGPETVGFLIQPATIRTNWRLVGISGGGALGIGLLFGWLSARRNTVRITANS